MVRLETNGNVFIGHRLRLYARRSKIIRNVFFLPVSVKEPFQNATVKTFALVFVQTCVNLQLTHYTFV